VANVVEMTPLPRAHRYHPRIASIAKGSISVGTVTRGYVADAAELPLVGPHHRVIDQAKDRATNFGTDEIVQMIQDAARQVATRHPGSVLLVGNISRPDGGEVPWSVSHNAGRDADISFYFKTPGGRPYEPSRLLHVNRRLRARGSDRPAIFDPARNWALVRALIGTSRGRIGFLFIAEHLKQELLTFARERKEPKALLKKAEQLLHQPRKALAHDDHLHLRIACPRDDLSEGCVEASRAPASAVGHNPDVRVRLPKIVAALDAKDPAERAGAAYLLGLYHATDQARPLVARFGDTDPEVRARAVEAALRLGPEGLAETLDAALAKETDAGVALALIGGLAESGATKLLAARLADPRLLGPDGRLDGPPLRVRAAVAAALGRSDDLAQAKALVPLLADPDETVRDEALRALELLTNRANDIVLASGASLDPASAAQAPFPRAQAAWRAVLGKLTGGDATRVVADGFAARGLTIDSLDRGAITALLVALAGPDPYRFHASRWLTRITHHRPPDLVAARVDPLGWWGPWLVRRRLVSASSLPAAGRDAASRASDASADDSGGD